jgi:hypothetical protein
LPYWVRVSNLSRASFNLSTRSAGLPNRYYSQLPAFRFTNPTSVNSPTAYFSDYWLVNAYYIRVKTIDIGYQLPTKLLPFKINNARIYLSAYNLFTWDNYNKYQQDPEISTNTAGDAYINQRVLIWGYS